MKKTLLIAAATLAAGILSTQAQAVYSQNVVGYVNVVCPASQYVMVANPLTTGNDSLTNVLKGVPGASQLLYWNGAGWVGFTFSALGGGHWKSGANTVDNTNIPPGVGFFIKASSTFTNTFVGNIVPLSGGGQCTNVLFGGVYAPVGSQIPYGDVVTNPSTINLQVAGASTLLKWDVNSQAYQPGFTYNGIQHTWKQGTVATNPVINVGEGFFIKPSSNTNWVQTLP